MNTRKAFDLDAYIERIQNNPCFICEIAAGRLNGNHVIYRDEEYIAFLNKYPTLYGYVLVAPVQHKEQVTGDFSPDEYLSRVAVKKGPKENGFRPSIDALFRSAAYSYGPGAVGVVLSGALNDGTSGLWTIKRLGGTAIVQDPYEAQYPSMPRSALEYVDADYRVRATEISAILARLASEPSSQEKAEHAVEPGLEARIAKEVQIAAGRDISYKSIIELGELTSFTCTECHGALIRIVEDKLSRYRCHTGHGYTEETLLESVIQSTGEYIWQTTRGLQEAEMLVEHIGRHMLETGDTSRAQKFMSMARELGRRANRFHELATDHDNLSGGRLEEEQE